MAVIQSATEAVLIHQFYRAGTLSTTSELITLSKQVGTKAGNIMPVDGRLIAMMFISEVSASLTMNLWTSVFGQTGHQLRVSWTVNNKFVSIKYFNDQNIILERGRTISLGAAIVGGEPNPVSTRVDVVIAYPTLFSATGEI